MKGRIKPSDLERESLRGGTAPSPLALPKVDCPNQVAFAEDAPKRGSGRRLRLGTGGGATFSRRPVPSVSRRALQNRLRRRPSAGG